MSKIPEPQNTTQSAIYALHERKNLEEKPRSYLGMSQIGEQCERKLWYSFRWAFKEKFDGRMLRLFETGHREETRILNELKAIGCKVEAFDTKTGKQIGVSSHKGHFRGHIDARVTGLPEAPKTPHLVDVKTTNSKKFAELQKQGMEKLYPKYWAQGHAYMGKLELQKAMYIFVNKDTDEIYPVRFDFDKSVFDANESKAERIIFSDRVPAPLSTDPSFYLCKWCAGNDMCHGSKLTKRIHCRTCAHSTPVDDGKWHCAHWDAEIPGADAQLQGCDDHVIHPDLTPGWPYEPAERGVIWLTPAGKIHNASDAYKSREIVANYVACASGVREQFKEFGAEVVG